MNLEFHVHYARMVQIAYENTHFSVFFFCFIFVSFAFNYLQTHLISVVFFIDKYVKHA